MLKTKLKIQCAAIAVASVIALGVGASFTTSSVSASAFSTDVLFESDYDSKTEAIEAGLALNEQIAEEGMILVKNENDALPITTGVGTSRAKVTLLGYASVDPNAGSSLNGGDSSAGSAIALETIYTGLVDSGFSINPTVWDQYETWMNSGLTSDYAIASSFATASSGSAWVSSIAEYDEAAIVVLSAGSGDDLVHSLQLDQEQLDLIDYAAENFDKVIVLINSVTPLEIYDVVNNDEVDAVLMVGEPGDNGFTAVGKILSGEVNPSGRMSDIWATDFTANPSYVNYNVTGDSSGYAADGEGTYTGYSQYVVNGETVNTWSVGYEEGIYVGYRWYETAYAEIGSSYNPDGYTDADEWYSDNVVLPFGYGLSYTTFSWEVTAVTASGSVSKNDTLVFNVKVTNTGEYAGKEVVQLYYTSEYTQYDADNYVEKAQVNLGDFAKTDILQPGQSQTVKLEIDVSDLAAYDYYNAQTYILETNAEYVISIATDSHSATLESLGTNAGNNTRAFIYTINSSEAESGTNIVLCNTSSTGAEVTNQLDDVTAGFYNGGVPADDDDTIASLIESDSGYNSLSRADFDGTMPASPAQTITLTAEQFEEWNWSLGDYDEYYAAVYDGTISVIYAESDEGREQYYTTLLYQLIGLDINDPEVDAIYQDMVEQLTLEELVDFVNTGGFQSMNIDYLGVPLAWNTDGPKGWTGTGTDSNDRFNYFASEPMIASTFNKTLAYEMGVMIGEQGLWGNSTQESGVAYSYTGWYAPGMNIHRSPFDSRYTEYYSEDPVLTGYIAANVSLGAQSKGAYITMKHFAFHNDGGGVSTYRGGAIFSGSEYDGTSVWVTEQAAREIYLKGYQICVEEGEADYMMSAFTRLGTTWIGGSYAVNANILCNEWGFDGSSVTDIAIYKMVDAYQLVEAGAAGIMLGNYGVSVHVNVDEINAIEDEGTKNVLIYCMQQTVKHTLYLVANSNAMQIPAGAAVIYDATTENDLGVSVEITLDNATVGTQYSTVSLRLASLNTYTPYSDITYSVTGLPDGLTFDETTGVISGTPTVAGTYEITVTASADGYTSASHTFTLTVEAEEADTGGSSDTGDTGGSSDTGDTGGSSDTGGTVTTSDSNNTGLMVTGIVLICVGIVAIAVSLVIFIRKSKRTE